MLRSIIGVLVLVIVGAAEAGTMRMGVANVPIDQLEAESSTIEAIRNSLPVDQKSCSVSLAARGKTVATGPSGSKEKLTAEICGKPRKFEIQRISLPDRAMITAKTI